MSCTHSFECSDWLNLDFRTLWETSAIDKNRRSSVFTASGGYGSKAEVRPDPAKVWVEYKAAPQNFTANDRYWVSKNFPWLSVHIKFYDLNCQFKSQFLQIMRPFWTFTRWTPRRSGGPDRGGKRPISWVARSWVQVTDERWSDPCPQDQKVLRA